MLSHTQENFEFNYLNMIFVTNVEPCTGKFWI